MKSIRSPRGCIGVPGLVFCASLLCPGARPLMAQAPSRAPAQPGSQEAWHESMVRTPLPRKGCFKASYPSTDWQGGSVRDSTVISPGADGRGREQLRYRGWHQR